MQIPSSSCVVRASPSGIVETGSRTRLPRCEPAVSEERLAGNPPSISYDGGAKAYVQSFSEGLHIELKPLGVHVAVLPPGPTDTPVISELGLTPDNMPMKPMAVEQCVSEGLKALQENRSMIIPGRLNRIMNAVVPASLVRGMMAKMFKKALAKPQPQ